MMIEQLGVQMRADERALFGSMIKRGQVYEHRGGIEDAMEAWRNALIRTKASVSECREALTCEIEKAKDATNVPAGNVKAKYTDSDPEGDEPEDEEDVMAEKKSGRVTAARNKLKSFLELEHACYFWLGTGYFQLRERSLGEDKEEEVLKGYKKEEEDHYEFARKLRLELMSETRAKATRYISTIEKKKQDDYLVEVPDIDPPEEGSGGIETQTILDGIIELAGVLNEQVIVFDDWRSKLVDLLQEPLVDSEGDKELRGDEVEVSVERQEESYAYMSALRALLADREQSLTEVQNTLIQKDTEIALHRPGKIHTSLFTKLIAEKSRVDPLDGHKSMKRMLSELRTLINNLKQSEEGGGNRVALERGIAEGEYKKLQKMMIAQTKACENAFKYAQLPLRTDLTG